MKTFFESVYDVVCQIPVGRVATYGQVAVLTGHARAARQVGYALHVNPRPGVIPCHRVVNRFGGLAPAFAFGGLDKQKLLLEQEGVVVGENGLVDLSVFLWQP